MTELPGKARPWFVSTQAGDISRDHPPAAGAGASFCSRQACTLLGAYETIRDIAKQHATVLHPGELLNRPLLPPSDSGGTSKGAPAAADPGACLSRIPYVGLHFTLGRFSQLVWDWSCPRCSNGHCFAGRAGGWGRHWDPLTALYLQVPHALSVIDTSN